MGFEVVAEGLRFPEGPVWMEDGSVIVVEIESGRIVRVTPNGKKEVVATPGGGPNGAAIGPDGALYVANSGGMEFFETDGVLMTYGAAAPDYKTGSIDRVDLTTGKVERLYHVVDGRRLSSPNDIVFDRNGGIWFTDYGKHIEHSRHDGGIFYARPDGSFIKRVVDGIHPNGIGLSPDDCKLYVALTEQRLVLEYGVAGPGELSGVETGGRVVTSFPGRQMLDSLALTADGQICVATLAEKPGIASIDPVTGKYVDHPFPDFYTTNICFGGKDMRDAWITFSTTGRLVKTRWDRPGLKLAYYA